MLNGVPWLVAAITAIAGFALIGWVVARSLRVASRLLEISATGADALARLATAAERLVAAIEQTGLAAASHSPAAPPAPAAAFDLPSSVPAEFRVALKQEDWVLADSLIASVANKDPDGQVAAQLREEFRVAREAAAMSLRARLDAAREANDPQRVLEIRETLAAVLKPEELAPLDRPLGRWFMDLIQKRLRQGAISPDVVVLATQVAAALDTTPEGASLRAALPTLRRSVGLCARCGNPYTGIADACPACSTAGVLTVPVRSSSPPQNGGPTPPQADGADTTETIAPEPE
jgi:hypothetical protein